MNAINQEVKDGWSADGQTLILFGMGYRLKKDLSQVAVGPVGQDGEPAEPSETHQGGIEACNNPVTSPQTTNYITPPPVTAPLTAKIRELSVQGKTTREIAGILKSEGIEISHMTVARRLQGVLL